MIWIIILCLLGIASILLSQYKSKIKGISGEKRVSSILGRLDDSKYKVLNDILLNVEDKSVQIDHIIVSVYGIFVIETKNYAGCIYGDGNRDKWIQYIGKQKNYFQNPMRQNYGHYKAIMKLLGLKNSDLIKSVVVFVGSANLKITNANNVTIRRLLYDYITYYQTEIIDINTVNKYVEIISQANITSEEERMKHIEAINRRFNR